MTTIFFLLGDFFLTMVILFLIIIAHQSAEIHPPSSPPTQPIKPPQMLPPPPEIGVTVHFTETLSPSSPPTLPIKPPQTPPPPAEIQQNQLNKIIDALIGAGDFTGWANILSSTDPSNLPMTATLFIPSNDAISRLPSAAENPTGIFLDQFLIPYHIVPQRLTFSNLQQYPIRTRLPTLLPSKFIVITNNSVSNFTIDDSRITHPDLFVTGSFSVHGVLNVLDYSVFGTGETVSTPAENATLPSPKTTPEKGEPVGQGGGTVANNSATSCCEFWITVSVVCAVFVFQILSSVK